MDKEFKEQFEKFMTMFSNYLETNKVIKKDCDYTLFDWLKEWYDTYKVPKLKDSGLYQLQVCINHLKKVLINKPLNCYAPIEIQKGINQIVSSRMRKYSYETLRSAVDQAYKLRLINDNFMDYTDKVKHIKNKGKALTLDMQEHFLDNIKGNKLEILYKFYLLTGCRLSEALTIKKIDVDFDNKQIFVDGSKTENAKREVPMFKETELLLSSYIKPLLKDNDYIFPYTVESVKCNFKRLKVKYNFDFSIHSFRHTFATRCLESGITMSVISKWLGHSKVSTTADIYTHVHTLLEKQEISKFNPKF